MSSAPAERRSSVVWAPRSRSAPFPPPPTPCLPWEACVFLLSAGILTAPPWHDRDAVGRGLPLHRLRSDQATRDVGFQTGGGPSGLSGRVVVT